jgi:hypothetical protein
MLHARRYLNYSEKAPGVSQIALVTKIPLIKVVICHFCCKDIIHLVSNIIEHNRKSCIDIERRTPQLQEEHEELQAQLPEVDIAMTLSWTRPYPDPTRCSVGSDPSRVPVGPSWAGSMSTLVGSGYPAGSGK